jgi:tetratricopeptide (TPR) repeat protein/O-antigen ligase
VSRAESSAVRPAGAIADSALAVIVLAAPLAVATVHPATWLVAWLLALVALGASALDRHHSASVSPALAWLLAVAGLSLGSSLLPLPPVLQEALSPEAAQLWRLGPVGAEPAPTWRPLHLAPGPGLHQLLKWGTVATFAMACAWRGHRWGAMRAAIVITAAGLISVTIAWVQTLVDAQAILGLYEPAWGFRSPLRATFVNPNHFGAWLGVVLVLAVGLLARREIHWAARLLGLVTSTVTLLTLLETDSRSGAIGAAIGLAVLAGLLLGRGFAGLGGSRRALAAAAIAAPLVAAALWVGHLSPHLEAPDTGLERPLHEVEPRLNNLPSVLALARAHPWSGVGRGAFGDAFPRFQDDPGRIVFASAESFPIQLVVDHGGILGLTLLVLVFTLIGTCLRSAVTCPSRAPAAAALVGLAAHEFVDFSVETGAVSLVAVLLATVCLRDPARKACGVRGRAVALACLVGVAVVAIPAAGHWRQTTDFARAVGAKDLPSDALQQVSEELWSRHPSSWHLALQLAHAWARANDLVRSLQWTNRAMLLAPGQPSPHLAAARLLRRFDHPRQALGEYRLALIADPHVTGRLVVLEVLADYEGPDALQLLRSPDRPELDPWIAAYGLLTTDERARQVAHDTFQQLPDNQLAIVAEAWALAQEGSGADARAQLAPLLEREDLTPWIRHMMARVFHKSGDIRAAVDALQPILEGTDGPRRELCLLSGGWLVELGAYDEARLVLRRARTGAHLDTIAESLRLEAAVEERSGNPEEALALLERAIRAAPRDIRAGLDEVRLLAALGRRSRALARLETLDLMHHGDPALVEVGSRLNWTPSRGGPPRPDGAPRNEEGN